MFFMDTPYIALLVLSLGIETVLFTGGALAIFRKVYQNHLRRKIWRTLLLSLGLLFFTLAITSLINVYHLFGHMFDGEPLQHPWIFLPYIGSTAALLLFTFILFKQRIAIDNALVNSASLKRAQKVQEDEEGVE